MHSMWLPYFFIITARKKTFFWCAPFCYWMKMEKRDCILHSLIFFSETRRTKSSWLEYRLTAPKNYVPICSRVLQNFYFFYYVGEAEALKKPASLFLLSIMRIFLLLKFFSCCYNLVVVCVCVNLSIIKAWFGLVFGWPWLFFGSLTLIFTRGLLIKFAYVKSERERDGEARDE